MSNNRIFNRGSMVFIAAVLFAGLAFSQNLTIRNGSSFSGTGTFNVAGDIKTPALTQNKTIPGTVTLNGTSQNIGDAANATTLTIGTLNSNNSGTKLQRMAGVSVSDALAVANGVIYDLQGFTFTISKLSALTGTGTIDVSDVASVVNYNRGDGTSQVVLGLDYAGTLNLSGAGSAKSFSAAGSAATMTHSGGDLTVNQTWSIGTSGTFATIADITGPMSFGSGATTASITTITNISTSSLTNNATGTALSITTLSGNAGTITSAGAGGVSITTATNGAGTITANGGGVTIGTLSANLGLIRTIGTGGLSFTGAASNGATIQGTSASAGAISFGTTLSQTGGTVTAGPGGVSFAGTVTNDGTSQIVAGTGGYVAALDFNGNVGNSGTITLGSQGSATFAGSFTTVGTLTLNVASNWTYDGAAQNIAGGGVTYGNLFTSGSLTKTALGNISVAGNFDNGGAGEANVTTNMDQYTLGVTGTKDNTNAVLRFGGLTNGLSFASTAASGGTVIYDGVTPTVASQTIAAGSYYQLQFENDAPKNMVTNTTVATGSAVSLAASVTLNVVQTSGTTTLNVGGNLTLSAGSSTLVNDGSIVITSGDLDNSGSLTNNGSITVQ